MVTHCVPSEMPVSNREVIDERLAHSLSLNCECILATKLLRSTHSDVKFKAIRTFLFKASGTMHRHKYLPISPCIENITERNRNSPDTWTILPLRARCSSARHCWNKRKSRPFTLLFIEVVLNAAELSFGPQAVHKHSYCTEIRTLRLKYSEKMFRPQVVQENSRFESKVSPSGIARPLSRTWPKSLFLSVCTGLGNQAKYSHIKGATILAEMTGTRTLISGLLALLSTPRLPTSEGNIATRMFMVTYCWMTCPGCSFESRAQGRHASLLLRLYSSASIRAACETVIQRGRQRKLFSARKTMNYYSHQVGR
jgi:hypothetical protein